MNFPNAQQSLLLWYYGHGLVSFLRIVVRLILFFAHFFSLGRLARTLFSPWHKDVSMQTWRGIRPILAARAVVVNIFSRMAGAVVRSCVIISGIVIVLLACVCGALAVVLYVSAPILFLLGIALLFAHAFLPALLSILMCAPIILIALRAYNRFSASDEPPKTMQELHTEPWFARVYRRIGIDPQRVSPTFLATIKAFTDFLTAHRLTPEEFERVVAWEQQQYSTHQHARQWWRAQHLARIRPLAQHWHYGYTTHLDRYSTDLAHYDPTQYGDTHIVDHVDEMSMIELIVARPSQNNAILVGPPGIGKNTLIHAFARRVRDGVYRGAPLDDVRVVLLQLDEAIADMVRRGDDAEKELHNIFHEATYAGNVIVVIENLDHYVTATKGRGSFVARILAQYLSLPTFRIVATATEARFHKVIEYEESLMKQCEVVLVSELTHEEAGSVLFDRLHALEKGDQMFFTYQALRQMLRNADRYNNNAPLPERALDLAMEVVLHWQKNSSAAMITADLVDEYVSKKTGVKLGAVGEQEREKLLHLEDHLRARVHAQEEAVNQCAQAVRKMRTGIGDTKKPVQSFLFLGPTGVGKTEMAKAITENYFGDEEKMIRLDMSEYQGADAIARLLGSGDGTYTGTLTTAAKNTPYTVLLLDEIEKAAPQVLDVFLQILDEGFVHDGDNKKISFRNMIIIATSEEHTLLIKEHVEKGNDLSTVRTKIINGILDARLFRVEFLNRFDHIILFEPLSDDALQHVAELILQKSARRLSGDHNIAVTFAPDVIAHVLTKGYDPLFGARSLVHYINDTVDDALAKKMIAGDIMPGTDVFLRAHDLE